MSAKKIIAVLGATGSQGGGLARAILSDSESEFSVRALTRNVNSDKAKALADMGAELMAVDIDDPESLAKAFSGAYGVYAVTFFWEHFSPQKEMDEVKSIAQAARESGVKHLIWSTLEDTRKWVPLEDNRMPTLSGKYKVPHFDAKGESNKFFEEAGVPTTYFHTSFYWDNLIYFGMGPKKGLDGKLGIAFPMGDKKLPGISADDIGKCALGVFKAGDKYINKSIGIAGEHLTGQQMAEALTETLGQEVVFREVTPAAFRNFGFPGADDLGNMFQFKADFEKDFCAARDVNFSRELNPELKTFKQWLEENKEKIPLE